MKTKTKIKHLTKKTLCDSIQCITFTYTQKVTNSQLNLLHRTKKKQKIIKKLKTKYRDAQKKNCPVIKSVELVLGWKRVYGGKHL